MKRHSIYAHIALITILLSVGSTAVFAGGTKEESNRFITVQADAAVQVNYNTALIRLGVETRSPSVEEAFNDNRVRMNAVLDTLRNAGIADEDMATVDFSVYFERNYYDDPRDEQEEGSYRVANSISVRVRDTERSGILIDAAFKAGANQLQGIEFAASDTQTAETEARRLAVEKARDKAETIAAASGVRIEGLESLIENGGAQVSPMKVSEYRMLASDAASPVEAGRGEVRVSVQAVYRISD